MRPVRTPSRSIEQLEARTLLSAAMSQTVPNTLVIDGTSGNDVLGLRYKGTQLVVILNNVQQRFVSSTISRIEIYAGEGHDIADWSAIAINTYINAGAGNDYAIGGTGNDSLTGAAGKDTLIGGAGDDRINGANSPDILYGGDGSDVIYGGVHDDYLDGGTGVDWLFAEDGNDRLIGGSQNDRLYGGAGADRIWGFQGNDLLSGDGGNDRLFGGIGDDQIYGGAGVDQLYGETGNDSLWARDGAEDYLDGGDGTDAAQVDITELATLATETIDSPVTTPPPGPDPVPDPNPNPPPTPDPIDTTHPVAISFNDEALWDANFDNAVAQAKKLGVTAIRLWMALKSWDDRPHAYDNVTLRQIVNTWTPTEFETRASIAGAVMKRAFELKRAGFTILLTVDQYSGAVPSSATQVKNFFSAVMNSTETPGSSTKFKDVIDMWEVGNEVDAADGWQPSGVNKTAGLQSYVDQLLLPAAQQLKADGETVVSSSVRYSSNDLRTILAQVKKRNMLSYVDYAGFHPYGSYTPSDPTNSAVNSLPIYTKEAVAVANSFGKKMIATEWNVRGYPRDGSRDAEWAAMIDRAYREVIAPNYQIAFYYALADNTATRAGSGVTARPASVLSHTYSGTITPTSSVADLIAYYESPLVKNDPFFSVLDGWK